MHKCAFNRGQGDRYIHTATNNNTQSIYMYVAYNFKTVCIDLWVEKEGDCIVQCSVQDIIAHSLLPVSSN